MTDTILKLGTRKSLLAWAQSSLIAEELQRKHKNLRVELVGIVTRGDQITDVPLSKIEGKEFFVKELDDALLTKQVDISVHSMKDLSHERPESICLGAVPKREDPRDIVVFSSGVMDALRAGRTLRIGTSSPRRLQNIPSFLQKALPQLHASGPTLEFVEIRGNVNTRLSRLHESPANERYLDGVVLALAGLNRLALHDSSREALQQLLRGTRFMVLPLTHSPTAPAQGALAIECRRGDDKVLALLASIHDQVTAEAVRIERELMAQWGGGCHQRFGITSVKQDELGPLLFKRGILQNGVYVDEITFAKPATVEAGRYADGMDFRAQRIDLPVDETILEKSEAVFLASPAVATPQLIGKLATKRLWCVGPSSWMKFAAKGLWVEGCADGIGVDFIRPTLEKPVLGLPTPEAWVILTHKDAADSWSFGRVLAPYQVRYELTDDIKASLKQAKHIFWSSGSQYAALNSAAPKDAIHACGAGKTARNLRQAGVKNLNVFPSREAWREWLAKGLGAE